MADSTASQLGAITEGVTVPNKTFFDNKIFARLVTVFKKVGETNDNILRNEVIGITASTTQTQAAATALTAEINEVSTCANASDAVKLPTAVAGLKVVVINNGAAAMGIFPATGDNLGAGVNTVMTTDLATTDLITFIAYDATNWRGFKDTYVT